MKIKRLVVTTAAVALLAGACSQGQQYGCDPNDKACLAGVSTKLPKSASPTPKRSSTKPAVTATATKSVEPTQAPGYKPKTYPFVIKDNSGYKPNQKVVYQTDVIVVRNESPDVHQFAIYHPDNFEKILVDSGEIKPGKTWTYKVTLEVDRYNFRDLKVPYIQSGHLGVAAVPQAR